MKEDAKDAINKGNEKSSPDRSVINAKGNRYAAFMRCEDGSITKEMNKRGV